MGHTVGIDVGGTKILAILFNHKEEARIEVPSLAENGGDAVLKQIYNCIDKFKDNYNITNIGISCAGIINSNLGLIEKITAVSDWQNFKLVETLSNKYNHKYNFKLENDANCALLGEFSYIKTIYPSINNIVMLTLGTGLGGAIIINNKLFTGDNGGAGEYSLIKVNSSIGERPLNDLLSGTGIKLLGNFFANKQVFKNSKEVINSYVRKDKIAVQAIANWLNILSQQINNIFLSLGINNFILGGGVIESSSEWWQDFERILANYNSSIKVHKASLNNSAGAYGAKNLFNYI